MSQEQYTTETEERKRGKQLDVYEPGKIEAMKKLGKSNRAIAREIGCSPTPIGKPKSNISSVQFDVAILLKNIKLFPILPIQFTILNGFRHMRSQNVFLSCKIDNRSGDLQHTPVGAHAHAYAFDSHTLMTFDRFTNIKHR